MEDTAKFCQGNEIVDNRTQKQHVVLVVARVHDKRLKQLCTCSTIAHN